MSTAFLCPRCNAPRLHITATMELGADDYSDERSVQLVECGACGLRGVALYEESRRGSDARVHHEAYVPAGLDRFTAAITRCAIPRDAACGCESHVAMREAVTSRNGFGSAQPMRRGY